MGDISQIDSTQENSIFESAKNMMGIGVGSKFKPLKASVVQDDEEQKVPEKPSVNNFIDLEDQFIELTDNTGQSQNRQEFVRNIIEELDEVIDIDREQQELNYMFMDENNKD